MPDILQSHTPVGFHTPSDLGGRAIDISDCQRDFLPASRLERNPGDEGVSLHDTSSL